MKILSKLLLGALLSSVIGSAAVAQVACPAGSVPAFPGSVHCILDPLSIPKYVTPLVIPPVMNDTGTPDNYDIAVRQFKQQILPSPFPPTTVWSYGPAADPLPASGIAPSADSQFNYPAYTIETTANTQVSVKWRNELVAVDPATHKPYAEGNSFRTFLPHLLPVDQTLHWANPTNQCMDMVTGSMSTGTDCHGMGPAPYTGPVPLITHVHGAHVDPHSDGYPEAWFLPVAADIPGTYVMKGGLFDDSKGTNSGNLGYVDFSYRNAQPATTLWYHDHALGMTRSNVYAGPAGFWLIRGGLNDLNAGSASVLPGPAPARGQTVTELNSPDPVLGATRKGIREIPIVIQDRSFKPTTAELFYPPERAFFEGLNGEGFPTSLQIPFLPNPASDIAPIHNPEAFFTTIVVNGATWPKLEVAPALYRFRLLNGCNSRFLNLALFKVITPNRNNPALETLDGELPFYQIGAEQGFLPNVVQIQTGFATPLNGTMITKQTQLMKASNNQQALLMALAERADVIVDFRGLPTGTRIRMINTAPDAPFGGFPAVAANPATTGQVMEFVVNAALLGASSTDPGGAAGDATDPWAVSLPFEGTIGAVTNNTPRSISLNEDMSMLICVNFDKAGNLVTIPGAMPPLCLDPNAAPGKKAKSLGFPMGPKAARLGTVNSPLTALPTGNPLNWTDTAGTTYNVTLQSGVVKTVTVTEDPTLGATEDWDIYNFTVDGHPIHLHLVRFQVIGRAPFGTIPTQGVGVQPWEAGYKDTVIALPGQITRVRAKFDLPGLFVWHCHIVEHEDNEMMRPYIVK